MNNLLCRRRPDSYRDRTLWLVLIRAETYMYQFQHWLTLFGIQDSESEYFPQDRNPIKNKKAAHFNGQPFRAEGGTRTRIACATRP